MDHQNSFLFLTEANEWNVFEIWLTEWHLKGVLIVQLYDTICHRMAHVFACDNEYFMHSPSLQRKQNEVIPRTFSLWPWPMCTMKKQKKNPFHSTKEITTDRHVKNIYLRIEDASLSIHLKKKKKTKSTEKLNNNKSWIYYLFILFLKWAKRPSKEC